MLLDPVVQLHGTTSHLVPNDLVLIQAGGTCDIKWSSLDGHQQKTLAGFIPGKAPSNVFPAVVAPLSRLHDVEALLEQSNMLSSNVSLDHRDRESHSHRRKGDATQRGPANEGVGDGRWTNYQFFLSCKSRGSSPWGDHWMDFRNSWSKMPALHTKFTKAFEVWKAEKRESRAQGRSRVHGRFQGLTPGEQPKAGGSEDEDDEDKEDGEEDLEDDSDEFEIAVDAGRPIQNADGATCCFGGGEGDPPCGATEHASWYYRGELPNRAWVGGEHTSVYSSGGRIHSDWKHYQPPSSAAARLMAAGPKLASVPSVQPAAAHSRPVAAGPKPASASSVQPVGLRPLTAGARRSKLQLPAKFAPASQIRQALRSLPGQTISRRLEHRVKWSSLQPDPSTPSLEDLLPGAASGRKLVGRFVAVVRDRGLWRVGTIVSQSTGVAGEGLRPNFQVEMQTPDGRNPRLELTLARSRFGVPASAVNLVPGSWVLLEPGDGDSPPASLIGTGRRCLGRFNVSMNEDLDEPLRVPASNSWEEEGQIAFTDERDLVAKLSGYQPSLLFGQQVVIFTSDIGAWRIATISEAEVWQDREAGRRNAKFELQIEVQPHLDSTAGLLKRSLSFTQYRFFPVSSCRGPGPPVDGEWAFLQHDQPRAEGAEGSAGEASVAGGGEASAAGSGALAAGSGGASVEGGGGASPLTPTEPPSAPFKLPPTSPEQPRAEGAEGGGEALVAGSGEASAAGSGWGDMEAAAMLAAQLEDLVDNEQSRAEGPSAPVLTPQPVICGGLFGSCSLAWNHKGSCIAPLAGDHSERQGRGQAKKRLSSSDFEAPQSSKRRL